VVDNERLLLENYKMSQDIKAIRKVMLMHDYTQPVNKKGDDIK